MIDIKPTSKLVFDLNMLQIDYNEEKKQSLRKEISEKYNVPLKNVEVNFVPITIDEDGENISLASDIIENIQDPKFQQKLFKEYIDIKGIEDVDFEDIINIDNKVNAFIDFDAYSKYNPYKIKYLKWDNYLSYGKGNYFDFTKLNGIVLLTGQPENQTGKTTLAIDLLRFALFGKAQKSPTLDSVFNIYLEKETEVMVEAGIEINGNDYVIRRTITRPALKSRTERSKAKQKVEYFKVINGDFQEIENQEGESGKQTNNIIKESVGNIEDFDLVISATTYTLGDLFRIGQTDKGKLFSRWLGLLSIEEKEKICKDLWKKENKKYISSLYNRATLESEINDMNTVIAQDKNTIVDYEAKMNESNDKLLSLNKEKVDVLSNKKEINMDVMKLDVVTVNNKINLLNDELTRQRGVMAIKVERYEQIKDAVFNIDEYNTSIQNVKDIEIKQAELRTNITHLKNDNARITNLIEQKICPTCGQNIDIQKQNGLIDENNQKIKNYINEGVENKKKIDTINENIKVLEQNRKDVEELNKVKLELSAIKVQIDNIKLNLEKLEAEKSEIDKNKENIVYNNEIDNKIRLLEQSIAVETNIKEQKIKEIQNLKNEINNFNTEIEKRNNIITKIAQEEKEIRNWNIYQELVGKNGIVKIVLKRALPILNNEIARLLHDLCDFEVKLEIDDNNKVCINLVRDGKSIDLGMASSGWEGCIAGIALRSALANIAALPRASFCVYDEVTSGVSSENVENIMKLFRRVKENYDAIIHICHDNAFEEFHDQTITIVKKDNISTVELK